MKFLDVQRLFSVTVAAQLSPYGRPDSSSLGWLLLFSCVLIHCAYTSMFLEPRAVDVDRDYAFTAGFLQKKKKSRTNIFYDNVDQNMLLKKILRSFIFTRHSTAEMLSVSQVIDRNGKKCRHRPAISFAQCASQGRSPLCCTLLCWL